MQEIVPLSTLYPGQSAEVYQVLGKAAQVRRLQELGLRDGVQLKMIRHGSPCIISVSGSGENGKPTESSQESQSVKSTLQGEETEGVGGESQEEARMSQGSRLCFRQSELLQVMVLPMTVG